jgi:hypothetical protein
LPGGRAYYERALNALPAHEVDTLVHCKYGVSRDGRPVYVSYDDNAHCKLFEFTTAGGKVPIKIGYDNTGRNPAAIIAQRTESGQWRARHEFIGLGIGMKAHAAELAAFLAQKIPNYHIERITCDPAGRAKGADDLDMRMIIAKEFPGVPVLNARTNDPATRIEAVDGTMRRMVNGEPAFLIHPDAKTLRTACINKYKYRKLKISGEERYTETPEKITPYSDVADALQYLMLGGGEGRLMSGAGKEVVWPTNGACTASALRNPSRYCFCSGVKTVLDSVAGAGMRVTRALRRAWARPRLRQT